MSGEKNQWDSNLTFILAMIGSAVGLGNIWRFPNVLYSNGGGSFMIPYIVSLFLLGISFVLIEYAVGFKYYLLYNIEGPNITKIKNMIAWAEHKRKMPPKAEV